MRMNKRKTWLGTALMRYRSHLPAFLMLCLLGLFFSLQTEQFFSFRNFINIMTQTAAMSILAVGLTFVLVGGHFDISGGSVLALVGVCCGKLLLGGASVPIVLLSGIGLGALVGLFNGFCVAKLRLSSFILTLTTSIMVKGIAAAVSGGRTLSGLPESFNFLGAGKWGGLPVPVLLTIALFVIFHLVLSGTIYGHRVYAVGEHAEHAKKAGIPVERIVITNFVLAGCLYGVAAIVLTGRLGAAVSTNGLNLEMMALSALAIGGVSMAGGRGNMIGAFLGCLIIGVLSNGLNLLNLSPYYADFIRGVVIFGTLALESFRVMWKKRG